MLAYGVEMARNAQPLAAELSVAVGKVFNVEKILVDDSSILGGRNMTIV